MIKEQLFYPYDEQSGIQPKHSTCTTLIHVTDYIRHGLDRGQLTGAVLLELKKAFDNVDFESILHTLICIGVTDTSNKWFRSYWGSRHYSVSYRGTISDRLNVTCGVPQGSILGPLLFVLFVNDLPNYIENCKIVLYVDDTALMFADNNPENIKSNLEQVHPY